MFSFEANEAVILEQQKVLEAALSSNPNTQKALQGLIRKVILEARGKVMNSIKFENGDPRESRRAVRTTVYKKILGANINILDGRNARHGNNYEPPRLVYPGMKGHRGGNRLPRSQRTQDILTYSPQSRGFVLRFVNSGTRPRYAAGRNGRWDRNGNNKTFFALQEQGDFYRGAIAPRNFFKGAAEQQLVQACDTLANLIDTELNSILDKKK
jgi:hypothetical protein